MCYGKGCWSQRREKPAKSASKRRRKSSTTSVIAIEPQAVPAMLVRACWPPVHDLIRVNVFDRRCRLVIASKSRDNTCTEAYL
jgi:hypothetical protein